MLLRKTLLLKAKIENHVNNYLDTFKEEVRQEVKKDIDDLIKMNNEKDLEIESLKSDILSLSYAINTVSFVLENLIYANKDLYPDEKKIKYH
jgi:predicted ester cyclase